MIAQRRLRSADKIEVWTERMPRYGNKRWVIVRLRGGGSELVPSFEDLFRIIRAICACEDEKYPRGKGRAMVREFLIDCAGSRSWRELAAKYRIPQPPITRERS